MNFNKNRVIEELNEYDYFNLRETSAHYLLCLYKREFDYKARGMLCAFAYINGIYSTNFAELVLHYCRKPPQFVYYQIAEKYDYWNSVQFGFERRAKYYAYNHHFDYVTDHNGVVRHRNPHKATNCTI